MWSTGLSLLVLVLLSTSCRAMSSRPPASPRRFNGLPAGLSAAALPNWGAVFNSTGRAFGFGRQTSQQQQQQQQQHQFSMRTWWESHTKGSKGLLIWLMPALLSQLSILRTVIPFFTERLSQYIQPMGIAMLVGLTPGKGIRALRNLLLSSAAIGAGFMFRDTFCAGSSWLPLEAKEDSYAVITGATSGLGRAFASLLYARGFSLVLIAARDQQLRDLRRTLLEGKSNEDGDVAASEAGAASGSDAGSEGKGDGAEHKTKRRSSRLEVRPMEIRDDRSTPSSRRSSSAASLAVEISDSSSRDAQHKKLPSAPEIVIISLDLGDADAPNAVLRELRRRRVEDKIDVLINNAEVGARGPLMDMPLSSLMRMTDLNVRATVGITRVLAPHMAKRDTGARILIVGNIASVGPGPDVAVYTASKAFLSSFASSLRRELLPQGVLVTLGLAGPMLTDDRSSPSSFARSSGTADAFVFKLPGMSMTTGDAAEAMFKGMRLGRDVVCPSLAHKLHVYVLSRVLPAAAVGALARLAWQPPAKWIPLIGGSGGSGGGGGGGVGRRRRRAAAAAEAAAAAAAKRKAALDSAGTGTGTGAGAGTGTDAEGSGIGRTGRLQGKVRRWFRRFWYSPVIDYSAIRKWLAYPFRPKGQDVEVDEDSGAGGGGGGGRRQRRQIEEDEDSFVGGGWDEAAAEGEGEGEAEGEAEGEGEGDTGGQDGIDQDNAEPSEGSEPWGGEEQENSGGSEQDGERGLDGADDGDVERQSGSVALPSIQRQLV